MNEETLEISFDQIEKERGTSYKGNKKTWRNI